LNPLTYFRVLKPVDPIHYRRRNLHNGIVFSEGHPDLTDFPEPFYPMGYIPFERGVTKQSRVSAAPGHFKTLLALK